MANDLFDSMRGKPELQQRETSASPWGPQQESLKDLFGSARGLYFGSGSNPSGLTSNAWQLAAARANDPNSLTNQAGGVLGKTIAGDYLNPNTNPYFQGAVNDALGLAKSQVLGLYGGPAGQNIGNSGFQEQLTRNLGSVAGNMYASNYNQERQNQLNALNQAPAFDYAQANKLAQLGALQEAFPWQQLARYQGAITGNYGGVGTTQAPWQDKLYNEVTMGQQAYNDQGGAAKTWGSMAPAMMMSDVRVKDNIERIGTHDSGIGIYKYTYKGDDTPQIGVLAQEVEQVAPGAVAEIGGIKHVNYKMI